MPAEGCEGHVATDGSLLGMAGKWGACGWSVVPLDHDEELGPLHGMYGSMEAKFEVQRTIKRAKLTAFLCVLKREIGPIKVHADNKGIIDGLWRGERKCIDPKAGDADLWIKIWEELHLQVSKGCTYSQDGSTFFTNVPSVQQLRSKMEIQKIEKNPSPWTLKVALRPSGVLLVCFVFCLCSSFPEHVVSLLSVSFYFPFLEREEEVVRQF